MHAANITTAPNNTFDANEPEPEPETENAEAQPEEQEPNDAEKGVDTANGNDIGNDIAFGTVDVSYL